MWRGQFERDAARFDVLIFHHTVITCARDFVLSSIPRKNIELGGTFQNGLLMYNNLQIHFIMNIKKKIKNSAEFSNLLKVTLFESVVKKRREKSPDQGRQ